MANSDIGCKINLQTLIKLADNRLINSQLSQGEIPYTGLAVAATRDMLCRRTFLKYKSNLQSGCLELYLGPERGHRHACAGYGVLSRDASVAYLV